MAKQAPVLAQAYPLLQKALREVHLADRDVPTRRDRR